MAPAGWAVVGFQVHFIVLLIVLAVLALAGAICFDAYRRRKRRRTSSYDDQGVGFAFAAVFVWICAGIALVAIVVSAIPFQAQYLKLYRVQSEVLTVSNVLDDASGDLTRTPVVELEGVDRPVVVSDPRIVRLEGADVTLTCTIAWHYQAADTYSCSIYSIDEVA